MKRKPQPAKKTLSVADKSRQADAAAIPASYSALLAEIKARVRNAQVRAHLAASGEMILAYWQTGQSIVLRQKKEGWGKSVIERLAGDLQREFPGIEGFSANNIWRMRAFYLAYTGEVQKLAQAVQVSHGIARPAAMTPILAQPVQDSDSPPGVLLSLPWGHNVVLVQKLKNNAHRLWYAAKAVENGWSRDVLALQIESALHERHGKAITNFAATLPPPQSDLAQQITKDPYLFDFLNLRDDTNERAVELSLLEHVEKLFLELGAGFALAGRQVHMEVGDQDFYLDLLFYHLALRCFIVVDLKARDFTPEAAGKMNFYLSAVDDRFRKPGDQPSIGIILCAEKDNVEVDSSGARKPAARLRRRRERPRAGAKQYALRTKSNPIGVAAYALQSKLPGELKGKLPTAKQLADIVRAEMEGGK